MNKFKDCIIDEIEVCNKNIFGDNNPRTFKMKFHDGWAVSLNYRFMMIYPKFEHLSDDMKRVIEDYTGRKCDSYFDIALKYGEFMLAPSCEWLEKELHFLMGILTKEQLNQLEEFVERFEEREYLVIPTCLKGDHGMCAVYVGKFLDSDNADTYCKTQGWWETAKLQSLDSVEYQEAKKRLKLDSDAEIERIYIDKNNEDSVVNCYYLISRPVDMATDAVVVWNKDGGNDDCGCINEVRFFSDHEEASKYAANVKCEHLVNHLEALGTTLHFDKIRFVNGFRKTYPSFCIWDDKTNISIMHGKYKTSDYEA